ncbi:MAG: AAA family ATPase [Oscillatoria sp. SIO1A7]|nr:AAA family ATPase [Oscillatoria sp. SIO1A7]
MHLQRVRVPDFRVLQDVDIEFEKEFSPKVFPLGSQNGGGKSTLLQLIFVLLHCSQDPERIVFLQNFLEGFQIPEGSNKRDLASFEIWDGKKTVLLEFFCCNDSYLAELVESSSSEDDSSLDIYDKTYLKFDVSEDLEPVKKDISRLKNNVAFLSNKIAFLNREKVRININNNKKHIETLQQQILSGLSLGKDEKNVINKRMQELSGQEELREELVSILNKFEDSLEENRKKLNSIKNSKRNAINVLKKENLLHFCNYSNDNQTINKIALIGHVNFIDLAESVYFVERLSRQIFFAAPVTQAFLFLPKKTRKLLFSTQDIRNDYYGKLEYAREGLTGFFPYDFLAVDLLVESFKAARDEDFYEGIATGEYGTHYKTLLKQLRSILHDKMVYLNKELSGVTIKINRNGEEVELYPEDLSHGELKRLSIYIWLKHRNIENAIVLMDEIETAFHPEWQYKIVRDLQDWAPSNQYILATHSYDLCEAVTPAHVRELEPKLLKSGAEE